MRIDRFSTSTRACHREPPRLVVEMLRPSAMAPRPQHRQGEHTQDQGLASIVMAASNNGSVNPSYASGGSASVNKVVKGPNPRQSHHAVAPGQRPPVQRGRPSMSARPTSTKLLDEALAHRLGLPRAMLQQQPGTRPQVGGGAVDDVAQVPQAIGPDTSARRGSRGTAMAGAVALRRCMGRFDTARSKRRPRRSTSCLPGRRSTGPGGGVVQRHGGAAALASRWHRPVSKGQRIPSARRCRRCPGRAPPGCGYALPRAGPAPGPLGLPCPGAAPALRV